MYIKGVPNRGYQIESIEKTKKLRIFIYTSVIYFMIKSKELSYETGIKSTGIKSTITKCLNWLQISLWFWNLYIFKSSHHFFISFELRFQISSVQPEVFKHAFFYDFIVHFQLMMVFGLVNGYQMFCSFLGVGKTLSVQFLFCFFGVDGGLTKSFQIYLKHQKLI